MGFLITELALRLEPELGCILKMKFWVWSLGVWSTRVKLLVLMWSLVQLEFPISPLLIINTSNVLEFK